MMFKLRAVVLFSIICCSNALFDLTEIGLELLRTFDQQTDPSIAEDARLTVPELIAKYGYYSEVHHVTTEDGYILEIHRIAGGPKSPPRQGKKVCFLMHGFIASSAPFVFTGPKALAFRLADEDYDIWMGNCRGNIYSTNHTIYDAFGSQDDQDRYWSFSLHEIGYYDVSASIDYVLNATGESKMHYLGHSQGSATFLIMASEKPEYLNKIEMFHAVNPGVYLSHIKAPLLRFIGRNSDTIEKILKYYGFNKIELSRIQRICRDAKLAQLLCYQSLMKGVVGETDQTNTTILTIVFGHFPAGASIKQLLHYIQIFKSGHFRKFDYGPSENLLRYNQTSPPDYDLQKITLPVAVYYAKRDWVTTVEDVRRLIRELPNVVKEYIIPHEKFSHADFLWGIDANRYIYDEIVKTMQST